MNRSENEKGKAHDDEDHPNKRYKRDMSPPQVAPPPIPNFSVNSTHQNRPSRSSSSSPPFIYTRKNPDGVVHVKIADTATSIPERTFQNRKQLQSVTIPSNVKEIGKSAFKDCTSLRTIHFLHGSQLTTIGGFAFECCFNLLQVTLPDSIQEINNYAFEGCKNLKKIILPSKLKTIGDFAFGRCSKLVGIILPEGLERIGYRAFARCSSLTFVEFKGRPGSLGFGAFDQCDALKSITFPPREQLEAGAAIAASDEKPFTFRSHEARLVNIGLVNIGLESSLVNIGFAPMEASFNVDVVRNINTVPQHPDIRRQSRYDDFAHYQRLCNTAVEGSIDRKTEAVDIRSIHLIERSGYLCGFQVNYFDSSNNNNGPKNQYRPQEEDDTSWSLHLQKDEFLIGLRIYWIHIVRGISRIHGVTFVTNQRQVHWGVRVGRFEPYALMFDDGNTISHRSRIVALAATYLGPNDNVGGRFTGLITGIGCYAKRFNWFTNNVGECIYLKWKLKMGHASEKVTEPVPKSLPLPIMMTMMDVDVDDSDDVGVFTNDVVVNLLSRLHDELFRNVIRFLY